MPRGDKSSYTGKQKRQAEHIEEGYEKRGVSQEGGRARAWATVNKETGGGKKSGSGRGKKVNHAPSRKGGRLGGRAAASRRQPRVRARPRRPRRPASGAPRADRCGLGLLDRNPGVAEAFLLHQREQDGCVRRMQPDAAFRGPPAELRDMGGAVDGEIAVVENRIRHRRVVVDGRAVVARQVTAAGNVPLGVP